MDLEREESYVNIQKVLKTFQSHAMDSLRGPSSFSTAWRVDKFSPTEVEEYRKAYQRSTELKLKPVTMTEQPTQQQQQGPIFLPMDTSSEKCETELEGVKVACFNVGGEKRLCLPQVLQSVLRPFKPGHVQEVCTDLFINFSRCSPQQLQCFKANKDLPPNAQSCGLVTKTDAERLVNKLLRDQCEEYNEPLTPNSFKVYHECFGKSKGIMIPELYTSSTAACIKCIDCYGLFSPEKFVGHAHKALENRTCHWGFDPANWRYYLHLAKDQDHKESLQVFLEDLKSRYSHSYKRKEFPSSDSGPGGKKARLSESSSSSAPSTSTSSSFRPWSPSSKLISILHDREPDDGSLPAYLQNGPPKLLNPERVIPFDHQKQYERHFAPNVSLAPVPPKKQKCREFQAAQAAAERVEQEKRARSNSFSSSATLPSFIHHHDTSDTDSVSVKSEASVQSPVSSRRPSTSSEFCSSWRGQEVELFHQALDLPVQSVDRERVLTAFHRVCKLTDDSIAGLASAARELQMEVEAASQREAQCREQLACLRTSLDASAAKHREQQHQITEHYRRQLQIREAQYGEMHAEMLRELHRLRDELRKLGKSVPDIAYDFELMGDCPKIVSPPESPSTSAPTTATSGTNETSASPSISAPAEFLVNIKEEKV